MVQLIQGELNRLDSEANDNAKNKHISVDELGQQLEVRRLILTKIREKRKNTIDSVN